MTPATEVGRGALGDFLRSRREALSPGAAGLKRIGRSRTPGLRRQEVAELAGIGIDWYIRLEQGRAVSPSLATLDALARALRLNTADGAHLRALGRNPRRPAFVLEVAPAGLRRLVEGLEQPAYVTGRRWDVLAWNAAAADVVADFGRMAPGDRNILVYMLTDPDSRRRFGAAWAEEARRMLAQFRTTHDLWSDDPCFAALLARLRTCSAEFASWWTAHEIRDAGTGQKILHHPSRGALHFEYATFQANDDPALKLAIYTPMPPC